MNKRMTAVVIRVIVMMTGCHFILPAGPDSVCK